MSLIVFDISRLKTVLLALQHYLAAASPKLVSSSVQNESGKIPGETVLSDSTWLRILVADVGTTTDQIWSHEHIRNLRSISFQCLLEFSRSMH
ncbi:hypothetical protein NPIL_437731 [Nephila pilipes]|uniref:Uncharacterized protein n=1 Tax=Nephila pilipes TaxID=299642 RepID=A0A8X6TS07_NEPPI|nr:hypothetical protein NPIL_437731 [Nephila pilipes]